MSEVLHARNKSVATTMFLSSFIALGISTIVLGPAIDTLAHRSHVSKGRIGVLFTIGALGYLIGSLIVGQMLSRVKSNHAAAFGVAVLIVGLIITAFGPSFWVLAVGQLMVGAGGAGLDVTGNSVILWLHQGGPVMAALHLCFSIGAIGAPILIAKSLDWTGEVRVGFLVVAAVMGVVLAGLLTTKGPSNPHTDSSSPKVRLTGRQPLLLGLGVLFYLTAVGVEVSFFNWIVDYGVARGLARTGAATALATGFSGAFFVGRFLSVPIAKLQKPFAVLLVDVALTMAGLAVMLMMADRTAMWIGSALVGLGLASLFPSMLSLAEPVLPSTGLVTSSFLAGSSVGSMTFPFLIGYLLDRSGANALPTVLLAGTAACGLTIVAFQWVAKTAQQTAPLRSALNAVG
jgi:MFS transporter, FHS family, Na+ dependent glucose transporter 1